MKLSKHIKELYALSNQFLQHNPLYKSLGQIMEPTKLIVDSEASPFLLYDEKESQIFFQLSKETKQEIIQEKYLPNFVPEIEGFCFNVFFKSLLRKYQGIFIMWSR